MPVKSWEKTRGNKPLTGSLRGHADQIRLKKAWQQFRQNNTTAPTNNRNAATGNRTTAPAPQGFQSRVGSK